MEHGKSCFSVEYTSELTPSPGLHHFYFPLRFTYPSLKIQLFIPSGYLFTRAVSISINVFGSFPRSSSMYLLSTTTTLSIPISQGPNSSVLFLNKTFNYAPVIFLYLFSWPSKKKTIDPSTINEV